MYKLGEVRVDMEEREDSLEHHMVTLIERLEVVVRERGGGGDGGGGGPTTARLEVRSAGLWRAVAAECAASFVYVVVVCGAAAGAGVAASAAAVLLASALGSGCAVAALTLCFESVSGAHVSPTVTVAACVRRRVSPLRATFYVTAQCGGAVAGAALIYGVCGGGGLRAGATVSTGAAWQRLATEVVLSALVVGAHCAAVARRWVGATPLLLAAAYTAATLVAMPCLNPARALGPAFVLSHWERHWVHWLGPLAGAMAIALLLEWTGRRSLPSQPPSEDENYDDLDKGAFPPSANTLHRAPSYCAAAAPAEPLYGGTKSLYCRSPQPARHALHRSQSVYSKSSCAGNSLAATQSLVVRAGHALAHSQNAHNAHRDPAYGMSGRSGPAGESSIGRRRSPSAGAEPDIPVVWTGAVAGGERRDSLYGTESVRRPTLSHVEDGAYGTYTRAAPYRSHHHSLADHY